MSNLEVWIAFSKSKALEGCDIDIDGSEFYYADVYVPVNTTSEKSVALNDLAEIVKNSLKEKHLELADISMLVRYKNGEWETKTDNLNDVNALAEKVRQSGEIVFSGFRSEEIEELQFYRHSIIESDNG